MVKIIVITDLDGCLLDPRTYDAEEAKPYLNVLINRGIRIIFNSSKTRLEQLYYREIWGVNDIFVVENGAAIHYPRRKSYEITINGIPRRVIEEGIRDIIDKTKRKLLWLEDMTPADFSNITGLPVDISVFALEREYSTLFHPLRISSDELKKVIAEIEARGFRVSTGSGRVYLVTGDHDKGLATKQVINMVSTIYVKTHRHLVFIGVGDGMNDYPMLRYTDYSIVLGNKDLYNKLLLVKKPYQVIYVDERGPKAWFTAINGLLEKMIRIRK